MVFVDPRPRPFQLNPWRNLVPGCPPENPDPKRSLDEEIRGPVDPKVAKELGVNMWEQQGRVWRNRESYADPWLSLPMADSVPDSKQSGSHGELTTSKPAPEVAPLYGPAPRNNESIRLGESLTNPDVIVLDDDDDGFEGVLDLYLGAVQGSTLSKELELAVWGDDGLTAVGWENISSLEINVKHKTPAPPSPPGDTGGSHVRNLAGYKRIVKEEKANPLPRTTPSKEGPLLGIDWSYSACGYATGTVRRAQKTW